MEHIKTFLKGPYSDTFAVGHTDTFLMWAILRHFGSGHIKTFFEVEHIKTFRKWTTIKHF